MERPILPLGDYYQLLLRHGLLAHTGALHADLTQHVTSVTCDSRSAVPGSLFVCKGAAFKEEYLAQAIKLGAAAYVSEVEYPLPAPCIPVTDIRAAMGLLADRAWGHPSGELTVLGLTGTKGKTTVAYFLKSILDLWRGEQTLHPVGLLSTIVTDDGVLRRPAKLTTPEPLDLQRHLFNALNAGCGLMVMEVSSQALKYGRVIGVELDTAVFLNIGEDHISPNEHPDWEDYFASKLKIFAHAKAAVVNVDSDHAGEVLAAAGRCGELLTYSLRDPSASVYGHHLRREGTGLAFTVDGREYTIPMTGEFNVSNALAALAVCRRLGVPLSVVRDGLAKATVPGRMETYVNQNKTVIVDYAHNGMALSALLRSVGEDYPGREITVVFGCTGGKGLDRREGMGRAADEYAHRIILTEDDPGPEAVEDICAHIGQYIHRPYTVIPDREKAIETAIGEASPGGVVVLAGKGSESVQKRKDGPRPCVPDGLLARKYLGLPLMEGETL